MSRGKILSGLRWRLRATRRLWHPDAESYMPMLEAEVTADGRLDRPPAGDEIPRGMVEIVGWALFPSGPLVRVEVWLGESMLGLARLGLPRVDLSRQIDLPTAGLAGFELTTDLSTWPGPDGQAPLKAVAISRDGERHELTAEVVVTPALEAEADPEEELDAPPPTKVADRDATRILVFTHQLTLGGAQLYLLDLLRELTERGGFEATVVSTLDGPLREELEALGIPSHVTSMEVRQGPRAHAGRVAELVAWGQGRGFDAAIVNTATATTFPGVEVATKLGIPTVWAIHESVEPAVLWGGLYPEVRQSAERSLAEAATVLFEAEATQRLFEPAAPDGSFVTIPYGLDLEPIDAARSDFDRDEARRAAGIPLDAELVLCVGTVEPRKAQVSLTHAFETIAARHPHARLALVGGRDDDNAMMLSDYIEASPFRDRIELIPITPDVQRWYGMADLLVCASDVESLPRTVLEAMAWEVPVLATEVYGLPELIEDGETGWLCPPRDAEGLAAALERSLASTAAERERMGRDARALVERRHSLEEYGRKVGALLTDTLDRAPADPHDVAGD